VDEQPFRAAIGELTRDIRLKLFVKRPGLLKNAPLAAGYG
jgi:hypothetical protein